MNKEYSCELSRLVCEALEKMSEDERKRFVAKQVEISNKLNRLKNFTGLNLD